MLGKGHVGLYNASTKEEERKKRKAKRRDQTCHDYEPGSIPALAILAYLWHALHIRLTCRNIYKLLLIF